MDMNQNTNGSPGLALDFENDLVPELRLASAAESKFSSLTLLIVTVILFFSAEIVTTKWQEILILIGVLLFHELGHLAAMKILRYNDVKMFFIPFIGAAVSGRNRNDTAVKSCLVSLMGPLPGIVVGVLLYILFVLTKNYYAFKTAQVMLLLNALNFLPIMPLDGGRYIDVLFVNRRYFRFLLAFFGAAIFLILAGTSKDFILGFFGVLAMVAAVARFKLHGISNDLKSRGIRAASVNDLIEDESSLRIVIDKLRSAYPKLFSPSMNYRAIFNQLTGIVDTVKFVPAKFVSKLILLVAYVTLVGGSVLVSFVFIAANYKEVPRTEMIRGKECVYVERHLFGQKISECPINAALFYDGKGTAFAPDGSIRDVFYYSEGYRTGEWLTFDKTGKVIEKSEYDKGRLIFTAKLEGETWKKLTVADMSVLRRCSEEIQRLSQPFKTNYRHFL